MLTYFHVTQKNPQKTTKQQKKPKNKKTPHFGQKCSIYNITLLYLLVFFFSKELEQLFFLKLIQNYFIFSLMVHYTIN